MTAKTFFLPAAIAAFVVVAFATSALAIDNSGSMRPTAPTKLAPSKLTSAECEGLGGVVVPATECKFDACVTTNKDGVMHKACLTKK